MFYSPEQKERKQLVGLATRSQTIPRTSTVGTDEVGSTAQGRSRAFRIRDGKNHIMSNLMNGNGVNIHAASEQWASRPNDERYETLELLHHAVLERKKESWTAAPNVRDIRAVSTEQGSVAVEVYDPTYGERKTLEPSNWAFAQLCQYGKAPAAYLRTQPGELAAINLAWGLEHNPLRPDALILAQTNGSNTLRAMTSQTYGRIWDEEVVQAVRNINSDGRWKVPAASYSATNPKRATTLYASDRDVFLFLVDPSHPVEVSGETLFRGFYAWNSEVGSATFGLTTFLYRYVCDNRIIWGAQDIKELRIRHTGGAPERFAYEGAKYLRQYSEAGTGDEVRQITEAKAYEIPNAAEKNGVENWLISRGFSKGVAANSVAMARAEEGDARSLWDIINGVTAHARSIPNTNDRVQLERQAGELIQLVA